MDLLLCLVRLRKSFVSSHRLIFWIFRRDDLAIPCWRSPRAVCFHSSAPDSSVGRPQCPTRKRWFCRHLFLDRFTIVRRPGVEPLVRGFESADIIVDVWTWTDSAVVVWEFVVAWCG